VRQDEDFVHLYLRKQNLKPAALFLIILRQKGKMVWKSRQPD